ncbi:MAG TPA: hypothetical protein VH142_07030 [Polyangiaceae bacterium]|nr:hypothetical protein [Polyangiaceae bacterium]
MEHERLMAELLGAAQKLGLRVRVEPFLTVGESAGGICKVLGKTVVLIDASSPILDRTAALARILATFDLESVYLAPEAREYIYAQLRSRSP